MLRWNAVLFSLLLTGVRINAGEPLYVSYGAAEMGMAFSTSAMPGHWNCFRNQALMTFQQGSSLSAAFENRYTVSGLSSGSASFIAVTGTAPLGVIITRMGNGDYSRLYTGLGSAVRLAEGLSLGLQADYVAETAAGDYRDVSHITFEAGLSVTVSTTVMAGFHVVNPLESLNSLPSSLSAALSWHPAETVTVTSEVCKQSDEPLNISAGMSWTVAGSVILRAGFMSSPASVALGAGYRHRSLVMDAGFMVNSMTGMSSSVSLLWFLKGK